LTKNLNFPDTDNTSTIRKMHRIGAKDSLSSRHAISHLPIRWPRIWENPSQDLSRAAKQPDIDGFAAHVTLHRFQHIHAGVLFVGCRFHISFVSSASLQWCSDGMDPFPVRPGLCILHLMH